MNPLTQGNQKRNPVSEADTQPCRLLAKVPDQSISFPQKHVRFLFREIIAACKLRFNPRWKETTDFGRFPVVIRTDFTKLRLSDGIEFKFRGANRNNSWYGLV